MSMCKQIGWNIHYTVRGFPGWYCSEGLHRILELVKILRGVGGCWGWGKGKRKVVPNTNSAAVQPRSSLRAERIPSSTTGREVVQLETVEEDFSAAFN